MDRYEAFVTLLARPDLPCLPARRHVVTCAGDPDRHVTVLPKIFTAWCQRLLLARTPEEAIEPAKKAKRRRSRRPRQVLEMPRSA